MMDSEAAGFLLFYDYFGLAKVVEDITKKRRVSMSEKVTIHLIFLSVWLAKLRGIGFRLLFPSISVALYLAAHQHVLQCPFDVHFT